MANASLATKYRPQTFQDVVGQNTIKTILSKASEQDKIAPAYLLCGTRGVGKTTLARVFAKALNCENSPIAEPCNVCNNCKQITQGAFVDVVEIDGASNGLVDDVRKLRESVGYSPLIGRYKVIIIDEAHMLSKGAFNALLKTLEEPPKHVVFVLATTEQHKFPITILSRCQQFVFTQVSEAEIEKHLQKVLGNEGIRFEEQALKLIARKASGSVRDSMSLLGQCLAFMFDESEELSEAKVREVLGLVGLELMDKILTCLYEQDIAKLTHLIQDLLSNGIDLGFFLKEFSTIWRNLFVLKQSNHNAAFSMPIKELARLESHASKFTLTYIHAAWQMTMDNQRRILQSLEPASALELLILNLALLPKLLPIEDLNLAKISNKSGVNPDEESQGGEFVTPFKVKQTELEGETLVLSQSDEHKLHNVEEKNADVILNSSFEAEDDFLQPVFSTLIRTESLAQKSALDVLKEEMQKGENPQIDQAKIPSQSGKIEEVSADNFAHVSESISYDEFESQYEGLSENYKDVHTSFTQTAHADVFPKGEADLFLEQQSGEYIEIKWDEFIEFCGSKDFPTQYLPYMNFCSAKCNDYECIVKITSETALQQIKNVQSKVENLLSEFLNRSLKIRYCVEEYKRRSSSQMMEAMYNHPQIQVLQKEFNAILLRCHDLKTDYNSK